MTIKDNFYVQLKKANDKLRVHAVSLLVRGEKLWMQATLPPKPGGGKTKPHQQRISTGQRATVQGLKVAENIARKLRKEVDSGEFVWENWSRGRKAKAPKRAETCAEWIELFQKNWDERQRRSPRAWRSDWWPYFKELPPDAPLSELALQQAVLSKAKDSCSRRKAVERLTALAKFAGVECDLRPLRGTYSLQEVEPRSLPPDSWIEARYLDISDPVWQRIFGLMAAYGFRNSEMGSLVFTDYPVVLVTQGKTGQPRSVAPRHKRWAEEWKLIGELPTSNDRQKLGLSITGWFRRQNFIKPNGDRLLAYDLRHCAARGWTERGANADLAARMLGHAPSVHHKIYRRFIGEKVWLERAMSLD